MCQQIADVQQRAALAYPVLSSLMQNGSAPQPSAFPPDVEAEANQRFQKVSLCTPAQSCCDAQQAVGAPYTGPRPTSGVSLCMCTCIWQQWRT